MKVFGIFFFLVVVSMTKEALALNCYTCSQASEKCIKGNSEMKAFNCSAMGDDRKETPKYCFRTINISGGKNETKLYNRGCLVGDVRNFCDLEKEKDSKVVCSVCSTSLCNSGYLMEGSILIIFMILMKSLLI